MRLIPPLIFSEFNNKISDNSYYPKNPIDALKAHLTATWLLQNTNSETVKQAIAFIYKTSTFRENILAYLQELAECIKTWDELQICSLYTNTIGTFLEYKLLFTDHYDEKKYIHLHAGYEMNENGYSFVSQTPPLIRVIGDSVLQRPGTLFPDNPSHEQRTELTVQIELAKSILIQTSGAGIAANQCTTIANPYRFTIVGVFHEIPEHVMGVERRYPGVQFPQAKVMLNPIIIAVSKETQSFNHACLSVPCANRCAVASPQEINVRYQDPLDEMRIKEEALIGIDAVVLWHELTHIVYGKTYMDVTFESLSIDDLLLFQKMLMEEIPHRREESSSHVPELTVPPFHFSVKMNEAGIPKLDPTELTAVLPKMTEDTLCGLLTQIKALLKTKEMISYDLPNVSDLSIFLYKAEKEINHCADRSEFN